MKNYVSNENESVKMFNSKFLEFFTHVHPIIPVVIFLPAIIYFVYFSFIIDRMNFLIFIVFYLFGWFVWSFVEYFLHRFVFHIKPSNKIKQYIYFMIHGVHHDYPNDKTRLVMVPIVSIPLAILFYILFEYILNKSVYMFFPGFLTGYLFYDMTHYAVHHFNFKNKIFIALKKHHYRHHYKDSKKFFGVSSPLWDYVFLTNERSIDSK